MTNISTSNYPPFHLIALDIDGTLLNPEHELTAFTKKTLQDVVAKYPTQVFVALASGRQYAELKTILDILELPEENAALVGCNGACAYAFNMSDTFDEKAETNVPEKASSGGRLRRNLIELKSVTIPPENVSQLISAWLSLTRKEANLHIYQYDRWLCAMEEKEILKYSSISGFEYKLCDPLELIQAYNERKRLGTAKYSGDLTTAVHNNSSSAGPLDGITKIFLSSKNHELLLAFRSHVEHEIPSLSLSFSKSCFLEIMAAGVSKLTGLQSLMPHLQACSRKMSMRDANGKEGDQIKSESEKPWTVESSCIAFGDNENDVPMLIKAARGCLMGNGPEALKESLKNKVVVVRTNYEDGVAHEIKKIFSLK